MTRPSIENHKRQNTTGNEEGQTLSFTVQQVLKKTFNKWEMLVNLSARSNP